MLASLLCGMVAEQNSCELQRDCARMAGLKHVVPQASLATRLCLAGRTLAVAAVPAQRPLTICTSLSTQSLSWQAVMEQIFRTPEHMRMLQTVSIPIEEVKSSPIPGRARSCTHVEGQRRNCDRSKAGGFDRSYGEHTAAIEEQKEEVMAELALEPGLQMQ